MIGTASHHDALPAAGKQALMGRPGTPTMGGPMPVTSDLTLVKRCGNTWVHLGYMPVRLLVLGCSVYSLGVVGGIAAAFRSVCARRDHRAEQDGL